MNSQPAKKPSRLYQIASLNWRSNPSKAIPHGLSGLLSIALGAHLIFCHSLVGNLDPYTLDNTLDDGMTIQDIPFRVLFYAIASCWNAIGGYMIVNMAPPNSRLVFKTCAVLQLCLSYYVLRFLPHTSTFLTEMPNTIQQSVHILDVVVTITSVSCTLSFLGSVVDISRKQNIILGQSIGVGVLGILLLSVYPIQLSIQGEEWWKCIQNRYPMQASGMVAYIYIPATVTFSLILFGATMFQRKILSAEEFGIASMMIIFICLLATVLSQEIHIPYVSTQRIYLPCKDPPMDSFEGRVLDVLDFSLYARSILTRFLGIKFEE